MEKKFGQLLLKGSLITQDQLDHALEFQKEHGGRLGEVLCRLGYLSNDDLTRSVALRYGAPTVNLGNMRVDKAVRELIPGTMARSHRIIPLRRSGSTLTCAMEDPTRLDIISEVEFQSSCRVQPVLATAAMLDEALERNYPAPGEAEPPPAPAPVPTAPSAAELVRRIDLLPERKLAVLARFLDSLEEID